MYQSLILGNVALLLGAIAFEFIVEYQSLILGNVEQQIVFVCIIAPTSCIVKW